MEVSYSAIITLLLTTLLFRYLIENNRLLYGKIEELPPGEVGKFGLKNVPVVFLPVGIVFPISFFICVIIKVEEINTDYFNSSFAWCWIIASIIVIIMATVNRFKKSKKNKDQKVKNTTIANIVQQIIVHTIVGILLGTFTYFLSGGDYIVTGGASFIGTVIFNITFQ